MNAIKILIFLIGLLAFGCTGCVYGSYMVNFDLSRHEKPEEVVRAYVEAILFDDCRLAESLVSPERRERARNKIEQECTNKVAPYLVSANIDDIMIEEWNGKTAVTLIGDFYTNLGPKVRHPAYTDQIMFSTEQIDGMWYVKP